MLSGQELLNLVDEGKWKGMTQWKCTLCPFDSVESKDAVIEHILQVHLAPPQRVIQNGTPLLLDRFGNVLISAAPDVQVVGSEAAETANDAVEIKKKPGEKTGTDEEIES